MKRILLIMVLLIVLAVPVHAAQMDFTAPAVPDSGRSLFPKETESFSDGMWQLLHNALTLVQPAIVNAAGCCMRIIAIILLLSVLSCFPGITQRVLELSGALLIGTDLLKASGSFITLGSQTIQELSSYGKLLLPVMTGALAAQGGVSASAALYTITTFFDALLCGLIESVLIPAVYIYIGVAIADSALGEKMLGRIKNFLKGTISWLLRLFMYAFTGFIGITGVVSGSADAAAVKAAKITISSVIPVVGGILSDASEAVLVSAGLMKSAAGIYGILAILSVCLGPFIQIGIQYLMLKLSITVCELVGGKETTTLVNDFSSAMGLILAMTGAVSLILLISTVCFMKGVS